MDEGPDLVGHAPTHLGREVGREGVRSPARREGVAQILAHGERLAHEMTEDGITSYEAYGRFGAKLTFIIQPIQYVQVRLFAGMDVNQEHFITFAKAGKDRRGRVDCEPPLTCDTRPAEPNEDVPSDGTVSFDDVTERNPVYNPSYDAVGRRFRAEEFTVFEWGITLALQFMQHGRQARCALPAQYAYKGRRIGPWGFCSVRSC